MTQAALYALYSFDVEEVATTTGQRRRQKAVPPRAKPRYFLAGENTDIEGAANRASTADRFVIDSASAWYHAALQRLSALESLATDWSAYGTAPPNAVAMNIAKRVLGQLDNVGFQPTRIDPSEDEGVCIAFRNGDNYADVECFNNGDILAVTSNAKARSRRVWDVSKQGLGQSIAQIRKFISG